LPCLDRGAFLAGVEAGLDKTIEGLLLLVE
jgi:hypothetical protein